MQESELMMRRFPYITVKRILLELWHELEGKIPEEDRWRIDKNGNKQIKLPITRITFYSIENELNFPRQRKEGKKIHWRVYSREEAEKIKQKIKDRYRLPK